MPQRQTVKIFLAEGNPTGLRTLELFNWNGKGFIIPRDRIDEALRRDELQKQGIYLLLGESEEGGQDLYIGESESIADRLRSHHRNKDFWDTALCFYSKDNNLNKAHVKFLEEMLIQEALEAGRVTIQNGNQPQRTRLSEAEEAEVLFFAESIKLILSSVGYTFLKKPIEYEEVSGDIYICSGPDADAKGLYTSEGMVVLKGSIARKEIVTSAKERYLKRRPELVAEGTLVEKNDRSLVFTKDVVFTSPSNAAQNVLARNANGWIEWLRESDGKTLDTVIRKAVE